MTSTEIKKGTALRTQDFLEPPQIIMTAAVKRPVIPLTVTVCSETPRTIMAALGGKQDIVRDPQVSSVALRLITMIGTGIRQDTAGKRPGCLGEARSFIMISMEISGAAAKRAVGSNLYQEDI